MKKLFLLFALIAMCSCRHTRIEHYNEQSILSKFDRVRHFEYKGHKYISFESNYNMNNACMGIIHDPDCGCSSK